MGTLSTFFQFKGSVAESGTELPEIWPELFDRDAFVKIDVEMVYAKILTDVLERTHGLEEDQVAMLWDNCLSGNSREGLVTMLAKAMRDQEELFIVYESISKGADILRRAKGQEAEQIKADYLKTASSEKGIFISFKNYSKSDMVKIYAGLEYDTLSSLSKSRNLSKAIQLKMSNLRSSTGAGDAMEAIAQAKAIARSLSEGKDILLDKDDSVETATVDLTATKESIAFLDAKRSFYLGMPASYLNGTQTTGIGTTGESDTKAVERGLKPYYFSILKPVLEELFETKVRYKSQDVRQIGLACETMKTFELVGEEYLNRENKKRIIEGLLDIDADDNETEEDAEPDIVPVGASNPRKMLP